MSDSKRTPRASRAGPDRSFGLLVLVLLSILSSPLCGKIESDIAIGFDLGQSCG